MENIQPELPQKMPINSGKLIIKSLVITDLSKYLAQYTPAELKKITLIDCSSNQFANLNIKNLPKLKEFQCCYSEIKSANIDAPNLRILDLSNNKIEDIKLETPLLEKLIISSNELSSLKLNLPNLKYMDCINNTPFRGR